MISDLNGRSFTEIFEMALFPTIQAEVGQSRSIGLSATTPPTQEVGTVTNFDMNLTFIKGTILNGDGTLAGDLSGDLETVLVRLLSDNSVLYQNNSASGTSDAISIPTYTVLEGSNLVRVEITYSASTTTYTDNKGGTGTVASIESEKADTFHTQTYAKTGRYYRFIHTGARGSSPTDSATIRSTNATFLGSNNTANFQMNVSAGTSELSLYIPQGKTVTVIDNTTNSPMTDGTPTQTLNVNDGGGNPTNYDMFVIDMGLTGFPADTTLTFNIT